MRKFALGVALMAAFFAVGATLASYTGPQRGTHRVCGAPHNVFYVANGLHQYVCSYKNTCGDRVDTPQASRCNKQTTCHDLQLGLPYLRVEDSCGQEQDPPATVSAQVQCNGGGGWCRDSAVVTIEGHEPVSGYTIVGIEGTLDGATFACNTAVCNVPVSGGGSHHLTYWALSSYGDTSTKGQSDVRIDADLPTLTLNLPPVDGANGWYHHAVTLDAQAADATSGLASLQVSVDGGAWQAVPVALSAEGLHTVAFRAVDVAGHMVEARRQVGIDTTPPSAQLVLPTPDGANGWYLEPVTVQAQGQDATSGIASAEVSVDGGAWQSHQATVSEGIHQVQVRVEDGAGWTATTQATVKVDTAAPEITLAGGGNGAPSSCRAALQGTVTDTGSGVVRAAFSLDGGAWEALPLDAQGHWQRETDLLADGPHTVAVRAWDAAGRMGEAQWQVTVDNAGPSVRVTPGGNRWMFWQTLKISAGWGCVPVTRLEVRIWEPGTSHVRKWVWEKGWHGGQVMIRWNTRWYSASGPYAHAGTYPVSITVWDAWGRRSGVQGEMVVPVPPTATPTAMPTATPKPTVTAPTSMAMPQATATREVLVLPPSQGNAGGGGNAAPQAPQPEGGSGGSSGPVVVNSTVVEENTTPAAPARQPLSHLPLWGGAAAAFLALWAAYAKRERLKRTWEEARARAAHIAWDAADRARRQAIIDAVARDLAKDGGQDDTGNDDADTDADTSPPGSPEAALLEGEVIDPHAAAEVKRSLNLAAHVPPHGDGSFNPFRGRGLWGNEHGPVTPTPADEAFNAEVGEPPSPPVDVAKWKQADYQGVAAYQAAMRADEAFDAEVGGLTPEEWYQAEQRAVALRIEQAQQQAEKACAQYGKGSLECALAWEQANQAVEGITREAALQPQIPYSKPPAPFPSLEYLLSTPRFVQRPFKPQYQEMTNDCGPFSTAIALNAYLDTDRYKGEEIAQKMNHSIWYRWPNNATWPWGIARYIRKQGVPARVRLLASERDLQEAIDQNRMVIVLIGGLDSIQLHLFGRKISLPIKPWAHYQVLTGYDPEQGYQFADPSAPESKAGNLAFQPRDEFLHQWLHFGHLIIEVGK